MNPARYFRLTLLAFFLAGAGGCQPAAETEDGRTAVDLIVEGAWVLTMETDVAPMPDSAVAIHEGEIVALGSTQHIHSTYRASEVLSGRDRIVMPGLINGHTHAAMTLLRGVADDLPLMEWLENYIFPAEVRFVDETFVRVGTELACWEMIRGGTTTFVDMYYFPDAVADVVDRCGMRAIVVPSVIDQKAPDAENGEQSLNQAIDFATRWKKRNSRVIASIGGHALYTLAPETLVSIRDAAAEVGVPVAIHLSESQFEIAFSDERYGMTPIRKLEELGFFDNKVIGAHVVYPSTDDLSVLIAYSVGAIHNPTSNMKISSGTSPVPKMLEAGVLVGLGTDGAASNNDLDLWEEIRLAALLHKLDTMNPQTLPARTALELATSRGAAAIGLGDTVGVLRPGMRADLIQVAIDDLSHVPLYDPVSHLAYVADDNDVTDVIIDGRVVMRDRQVLTLDAERIRSEASQIAETIREGLKLR